MRVTTFGIVFISWDIPPLQSDRSLCDHGLDCTSEYEDNQ